MRNMGCETWMVVGVVLVAVAVLVMAMGLKQAFGAMLEVGQWIA